MTPPDQAGANQSQPTQRESAGPFVPSFISAKDLARDDKLFFDAGRFVRGSLGFLTLLMVMAALAAAFILEADFERGMSKDYDHAVDCAYHGHSCILLNDRVAYVPPDAHPAPLTPPPVTQDRYRAEMALRNRLQFVLQLSPWVAGAIAIPFFLWLVACALRGKPARVVVLNTPKRPKGNVRKMLRRELRPYGHIIAVRESARGVNTDGRLHSYAKLVRNKLAMNLRAFFAPTVTLPVNTTPEWRPTTTQLLAHSSDALVVDLSNGKPDDWSAIQPYASRCVFVSAWGQQEQAEASFANLGLPGQCFFYAPDGEIQRRWLFRAAMLAAMRAAHPA